MTKFETMIHEERDVTMPEAMTSSLLVWMLKIEVDRTQFF